MAGRVQAGDDIWPWNRVHSVRALPPVRPVVFRSDGIASCASHRAHAAPAFLACCAAQRAAPSATGMGILVIEDETGRVQVACSPTVADTLRLVLAESRFVAVSGRVERTRWHRSLLGRLVRPLPRDAGSHVRSIAERHEGAQRHTVVPA